MPIWPNRSGEAYIAMLSDDDHRVRRQAAAALEVLNDRQAVEPLIETLLHDENAFVRGTAARALGKLGDPRAVAPLLVAFLHDPDRDEGELVSGMIYPALVKLTQPTPDRSAPPLDDTVVSYLIEALRHRDSIARQYAAHVLRYVTVPDPRIGAALTTALQDEDVVVRQEAAESLRWWSGG